MLFLRGRRVFPTRRFRSTPTIHIRRIGIPPVNVLLPTDYDEQRTYPVLYILHGYWDTQDWMARDAVGLNVMLGNLWASGEAEEMIVVLPLHLL